MIKAIAIRTIGSSRNNAQIEWLGFFSLLALETFSSLCSFILFPSPLEVLITRQSYARNLHPGTRARITRLFYHYRLVSAPSYYLHLSWRKAGVSVYCPGIPPCHGRKAPHKTRRLGKRPKKPPLTPENKKRKRHYRGARKKLN